MQDTLFLADASVVASARELLDRFGDSAGIEAAMRASRSRDVGNVIHFCRWRQVERLVDMLGDEGTVGTVH